MRARFDLARLFLLAPALAAGLLVASPPASAQSGGGDTSAVTGISRLFNPAISLNGLIVLNAEGSNEEPAAEGALARGLNIQETELQLTADIDPYTRADVVVAFPGLEGVEIEEAIIAAHALPGGIGFRFGKLLQEFGRHNRLHTHAFPFLDPPLANARLLGEEGLSEVGGEATYLTPLPWYSEVIGAVFQGDNERLASPDENDFGYLLRTRNFWDLDPTTTLDLGLSGVVAPRDPEATYLANVDLSIVRGAGGGAKKRKLVWQSEWMRSSEIDPADPDASRRQAWGVYSLVQAQARRRFWIQGRYDHFEPGGAPGLEGAPVANRWTWLLAFVPSEFSALRLQHSVTRAGGESDHEVALQFNFTIGSHPAHRY